MIIKSLTMKNMRSYRDRSETIDFPEGTVLIEGDVGSGKSTILYSIEFALFGLAEMGGSYLLAESKNTGFAELTFETGGKTYTVHRGLKRGKKSVTQEDCYIVVEGRKEELSPTDMKGRVVDILKFNEPPSPRAHSLIYRYAIFTPQEKMKDIVGGDPDARLQTLRKVLGLEDYKIASDNSVGVIRSIKSKIDLLVGGTVGLEEKEAQFLSLKGEIDEIEKSIPRLMQSESAASIELDELNAKQRALAKDREALVAISKLIPELETNLQNLNRQAEESGELLQRDEKKLSEDLVLIKDFERRKPPTKKSLNVLENEKTLKQAEEKNLLKIQSEIEHNLKQKEELVQKGVCPVCKQKIAPGAFGAESKHLRGELRNLNIELEKVGKTILNLGRLEDARRGYDNDKEEYDRLLKEKLELEPVITEVRNRVKRLGDDIQTSRRRLEELKVESDKMAEVSRKMEQLDEKLKSAQVSRDQARDALTKARTQKEEKGRESTRIEAEIQKMKLMRSEAGRLRNYQAWLISYFKPTVEEIERERMVQMNLRFNSEFRRFYSTLLEDQALTVRVDEEFKPVFERQSYQQEYDALSGGERTSVALAYRLALNTLIQQVATSAAGELLILDEPTDGFSKGQLSRIGEVLQEVRCKQVILVSHESELEGMADHIIQVEKVGGASRVQKSMDDHSG